jgi:hypothetical protein
MNTETKNAGDGPAERGVRPALDSEALLHAGKCRTWAAKTFNDTPDAALCVEAGDRLLYAAQLLDAQALEINRLRASLDSTTLSRFLSDVTTAAGLLEHGKRDKGLAKRMADRAQYLREKVLGPNTEGEHHAQF